MFCHSLSVHGLVLVSWLNKFSVSPKNDLTFVTETGVSKFLSVAIFCGSGDTPSGVITWPK